MLRATVGFSLLAFIALVVVLRNEGFPRGGTNLRRLGVMSGMDPLISFCFNEHFSFTKWGTDAWGNWQHSHVLARPGWQKSTRCVGESSMSCDECVGESSCWSSANDTRRVVVEPGGDQQYTRYLNTIQVRCNSPTITVNYEVEDIRAGQLRILWDGIDVSQQWPIITAGLATPLVDQNGTFPLVTHIRSGSLSISTEHAGAHMLQFEFTPSASESSSFVKLSKLEVMMPKEFAECEDYKACLDPIAANHELRNNNALQLQCIQGDLASEDCGRWRACLTEERTAQLRTLLFAAGIGGYHFQTTSVETTSLYADALLAAENESDESNATVDTMSVPHRILGSDEDGADCINPLVQDPQSWACDCFDEMVSSCTALIAHAPAGINVTEELCMRAKFCEDSRVCSAWKQQACDADEVTQVQSMLGDAPHRMLSARRGTTGRSSSMSNSPNDEALERVLESKQCM